ncbi:MAG: LacI family transcriptional regulator [Mesorhizobium sp.]|nr:MAG: LacI family transcriptional regulator [Mesorhizobium sp.]
MNGKPTIRDVAALAGVSTASVTRALTQPDVISETLRERVLAACKTLGYRANRQAVDFRKGRSNTIIVLVSDIANPFYSEFFAGIEEQARSEGYVVLIGDTASDPQSELTYVAMLMSGKADGLVSNTGRLLRSLPRGVSGELEYDGPPIVVCNRDAGEDFPVVRIGNYAAGRRAAEHLIGLGHRSFVQIHGSLEFDDFRERLQGFSDAVTEAGLPAPRLIGGDKRIRSGREAVDAMVGSPPLPTAIFAHNDEMALGVIHQLGKHGYLVPRDLSVVGFDDLNYASATSPALTTLRIPRREWGAAACRQLLSLVEHGNVGHPIDLVIEAEIKIRASSAPPRAS